MTMTSSRTLLLFLTLVTLTFSQRGLCWSFSDTYSPADGATLTTPGHYTGFFYTETAFADTNSPTVRGRFTLALNTTNGSLTAKALLMSGSLTFSAKSWSSREAQGLCRVTMTARTGQTLSLAILQNRLWGTMSGGSLGDETFVLEGSRNRFAERQDAAAQSLLDGLKGYYTVSLPPAAAVATGPAQTVPQGSGYLTLTVGRSGSVRIAGALADGTSVSQSGTLEVFDDGALGVCVPLFVPLYAKQGSVGGVLWLQPSGQGTVTTDRDRGWFVRWDKSSVKSDGAAVLLDAVGGYYGSPAAVASHYLLTADLQTVPYYLDGTKIPLQTAGLPEHVDITTAGGVWKISPGQKPNLIEDPNYYKLTNPCAVEQKCTSIYIPIQHHYIYDYSATNCSLATVSFTARTGIFRGKFNLYYDYISAGGCLTQKILSVPYIGILTPVRDAAFAAEPAGQGYYLVPDTDPRWRANKFKHAFRISLDAAP